MGTTRIVKMAMGAGAAILVLALAPATMAYASPAAFVPCSSGAAGLVAAITAANGGGGGTINLAPGCTYNLTTYNNVHPAPPPNSMAPPLGANGLPVITSHITINGLGTTIAGNNADFRIFEVDGPGGNLTLQGLTITGGATIGAGTAFSSFGGGILNIEGAITLNHSQVTGNTSDLAGGGIASGVVDPNHLGPIGTLTLNFSQVSGNTTNSGGGGGILNHAGTLTMNFGQVNNNTSAGGGGGIASGPGNGGAAGSSSLNLFFSQVNGNTSTGGPMDGAGGIANGGVATITLSQVNNNTAPGAPGGGILNHGTMTINLSQVNNNTAPSDGTNDGNGGGIANISLDLAFGISGSGVLTVDLSQINNNSASGVGGGILEDGVGPPPDFPDASGGPLVLRLSQVTGNSSGSGGGIYASAGRPVTLKLTTVAKNTLPQCVPSIPPSC